MTAGLLVAALGFGLLTQAGTVSGLAAVVAGSVVLSTGPAPVTTLVVNMVLGSTGETGTASGLSESSTEFGGALGIAILGSVATAVYRSTTLLDPPA